MSSTMQNAYSLHPRQEKTLTYGTAGFRDRWDLPLHAMFVRMGMLAVLRSRSVRGQAIGVMITASHNEEHDNGVKLVDGDGGMLSSVWEPYAERLANAATFEDYSAAMQDIEQRENVLAGSEGFVVIGRDTRPHSSEFRDCVAAGAISVGGQVVDLGLVTTPQLHFIVQRANNQISGLDLKLFDVQAALADYYTTMSKGYFALIESVHRGESPTIIDAVVVDASCGIGAVAIVKLAEVMGSRILIDVRNDVGSGRVNEGCGAELVQKQQIPPKGVDAVGDLGKLLCSFDGDADRIVFHSFCHDGTWRLIDGDKIAALLSVMLVEELHAAGLSAEYTLGIVQTAYANGASTSYLRKAGVTIAMAKTGVKYLHHVAQSFDLGIYFEANGHGTVLISERFNAFVKEIQISTQSVSDRKSLALVRLKAFTEAINQAVGDAISDLLVTLASLQILGMDTMKWINLFTDLPSKQLKIPVQNKSVIVCSEDETYVLEPKSLALELQTAMAEIRNGRCFVRPSGTEDVVRVYAEADTVEGATLLAEMAKTAVAAVCT